MKLPIPEQVEFIFDEQGRAGKRARETFQMAKHFIPPDVLDYVRYDPLHRSDKDFLPLQSADMLAWQSRRTIADSDMSGLERASCYSETMRSLNLISVEEHRITRAQLYDVFVESQLWNQSHG